MNQPLDLDTWYRNRLRVEVIGAKPAEAEVQLTDEHGQELQRLEKLGNLAILHTDPPTNVVASIKVVPYTHSAVVAALLNSDAGQVIRLRFTDVQFTESGHAMLELASGEMAHLGVADTHDRGRGLMPFVSELGAPGLRLQGAETGPADRLALRPSAVETFEATWDAPDFVWMGETSYL